jgi:crotonobetainyl-CoA:carnitine CoA-transferase CaiB-like acyl-CoA transferase
VNRNKRSIALNLKKSEHREIIYRLTARSDAVVENFVPGVAQQLKVDYETLKQHKEDLVYCSISGYGDIGPLKNSPAFDNIIQAETGFMHLTGAPNTEPFKMGFAISDVLAGLYSANAILAGILHRNQTGKGIHLKTSLYECSMASLINQGSNYLNGKTNPNRLGNHHPNIVPYGLYNTKDSNLIICVGTPQHYKALLEALQLENHDKYTTNELRIKHRK